MQSYKKKNRSYARYKQKKKNPERKVLATNENYNKLRYSYY